MGRSSVAGGIRPHPAYQGGVWVVRLTTAKRGGGVELQCCGILRLAERKPSAQRFISSIHLQVQFSDAAVCLNQK